MLSEDEQEMLDDVDYLYKHYRDLLSQGKTNVTALNTVIRALKAVHRYYRISEDDDKLMNEEN
mgnify:CR=1 FL=1